MGSWISPNLVGSCRPATLEVARWPQDGEQGDGGAGVRVDSVDAGCVRDWRWLGGAQLVVVVAALTAPVVGGGGEGVKWDEPRSGGRPGAQFEGRQRGPDGRR